MTIKNGEAESVGSLVERDPVERILECSDIFVVVIIGVIGVCLGFDVDVGLDVNFLHFSVYKALGQSDRFNRTDWNSLRWNIRF